MPEPGVDLSQTEAETTEKADKSGSGGEMRVETKEWVIDDSAPHWKVDNDTLYGGGGISSAVESIGKTQTDGDQIFGGGKMAD